MMTDWLGKPYHSLDYHLKEAFGRKVYKLALDGGMTCPNRDGTLGTGGCIFCSAGGSGEFAAPPGASVKEQVEQAKARVSKKLPKEGAGYIAYFQSYTNTYAPSLIWNGCLRKRSACRKSAPSPSGRGPTACRMRPSASCPVSTGKSRSGWSWDSRPSMSPPRI